MKNNKGITLIALVVTIIVLLILAGVSIAMLTGKNGILNNARRTSTENAYYSAEERVKLAYMAVRTEIMSQTVKDGSYDPTKEDTTTNPAVHNVKALAELVKKDLVDDKDNKWTVQYTTAGGTGATIWITLENSLIDQDSITTGKPQEEGKVHYKIVLSAQSGATKQTCEAFYDIGNVVPSSGITAVS